VLATGVLAIAQQVGIVKCKIKVFQEEELTEDAQAQGKEPRYLDLKLLQEGKEVEYEMPDVNENFPYREIEIRM